jgi:hypothetical protein
MPVDGHRYLMLHVNNSAAGRLRKRVTLGFSSPVNQILDTCARLRSVFLVFIISVDVFWLLYYSDKPTLTRPNYFNNLPRPCAAA